MKMLMNYVLQDGRHDDGTFVLHPEITADDWRQAQNVLSDLEANAASTEVRFIQEGNRVREVIVIPSSQLLKEASLKANPVNYLKDAKQRALKVYKNGLTTAALGEDPHAAGFDKIMCALESAYFLHELDVPEAEIKYQCSCRYFWQYYKCSHSLGMSILKKGVQVPAIYNVTNIGNKRRRGRPKVARGGEALTVADGARR